MKKLYYSIFMLLWVLNIQGQQLSSWSSYYENGFIWNPALTAKWNAMETSITHRQDWVGFDDAPEYSAIAVQYPFISRTHKRSSLGVFLDMDKVGPLERINIAGTYAYGFSPQLMGKRDDVLTMGIKANFSRFQYNPTSLISFDENFGTVKTPEVIGNPKFSPNVSFGIFYNSVSDFYAYLKSHYYAGIAVNNMIPSKIVDLNFTSGDFSSIGSLTNSPHASVHLGYRHIPSRRAKHFIEPNMMIIYSFKKVVNAMSNIRYEKINKYWGSVGAATNGEVFLQAGLIFDKKSILKSLVKEGALRLGVKMDYHLGGFGRYAGVGYEFYGAYIFEVE